MPKKVTFEEALKKLSNRNDLSLEEKEWKGWSQKCLFFDNIANEHFIAKPEEVFRLNQKHPNRSKKEIAIKNSISFTEASIKFSTRKDIEICEDGYSGWCKKSKFFDKVVGEYWYSVPKSVHANNSVHPKRRNEKRKKTSLKKYGHVFAAHSTSGKSKTLQTNLKKYGCEHPAQSQDVKTKVKKRNLEKYGTTSHFTSEKVKEKIKHTNIEKYGYEHYSKTQDFKEKVSQTNLAKYGVTSYSKTNECKEKVKETNLEKYGKENFSKTNEFRKQISNRYIAETGQHLKDWLYLQPEPKPAYISIANNFSNDNISLKDVQEYLSNYKQRKTRLEVFCEQSFNLEHFNKRAASNIAHRPDFRLSENIFMNADGLWWHSEENKGKNYHFQMRKDFEKSNMRIFQFYENEIYDKGHIVKSILDNALGKTKQKIFARKCEIKKVAHKEGKIFLDENHLMGSTNAKHFGLYHEGRLVSLLSFKKKQNILKIERFCSLAGVNVVGGFSKLLKSTIEDVDGINEIHNWVDLRYGTGNHLANKNFYASKEILSWKWTDGKQTYNRLSCKANMDERKLAESQYASEFGWYKIYDAGQRLWVKKL